VRGLKAALIIILELVTFSTMASVSSMPFRFGSLTSFPSETLSPLLVPVKNSISSIAHDEMCD
jgi:hypothetical protein